MRANLTESVMHYIRGLLLGEVGRRSKGQSDGVLLEQFLRQRSEASFAGLLERHGPMVLSVCQRVLGDEHLAEDAFQATFLVLARKAGSIRKRDALASWLHGVALRLARKLQAQTHRADLSMRAVHAAPIVLDNRGASRSEEHTILDEELQRLPERYRVPLVLCYLEGRTHNEAAEQLGFSTGKLRGLLDRGRERLRFRLVRRGVALPPLSIMGGAATLLSDAIVTAAVPPLLAVSTVKAAASIAMGTTLAESGVSTAVIRLTEGGLQMIGSKKAFIAAVLVLCAGIVGSALALLPDAAQPFPVGRSEAQASGPGAESKKDPLQNARPTLVVRTYQDDVASSMALSTDKKWLVTGSYDNTASLWNVSASNLVRVFRGHTDSLFGVALSKDGRWLATASSDMTARVWDLATGKTMQTFTGHTNRVYSVSFSADGKLLATGGHDHTARVWDVATGKELRVFEHDAAVMTVILSSDGKRLFTGCRDKWVHLCELDSGKRHKFLETASEQGVIAVSDDFQWLATASDRTVSLWDVRNLDARSVKLAKKFEHRELVSHVAFSAEGKLLATANSRGQVVNVSVRSLCLWDTASGEIVRTYGTSNPVGSMALSADGKQIAASYREGNLGLEMWEEDIGPQFRHRVFRSVQSLGRHDVAGTGDGKWLATTNADNSVQVWDMVKGQQVRNLKPSFRIGSGTALTGDGTLLFAGSLNVQGACSLDLTTGKTVHQFPQGELTCVAVSADAKWLITGSDNAYSKDPRTARIWDVAKNKETHVLQGHPKGVAAVALTADGKYAVTGGRVDGTARLWEVASGKEIRSFQGPGKQACLLALSGDGKFLATTSGPDHGVLLWDVATGKQVASFQGHTDWVNSLTFSADNRWLVTGSRDHRARLWEVNAGIQGGTKEARQFRGHGNSVTRVALIGDRRLVTASWDQTVRVWDVASGKELCTLVSFPGDNWLVVDAEGRYDSSNDGNPPFAKGGVHWVVGNDTFPLSRFRDRFYDPGLLAKHMGFHRAPLR